MTGRSSHLKHTHFNLEVRGFRHRWGFRRHGLSNPQPRNPYSEARFRPKSETLHCSESIDRSLYLNYNG